MDARKVIQNQCPSEDTQTLGTTIQNLVTQATWKQNLRTPHLCYLISGTDSVVI